jgi:hypothetical protein
LIASVTGASAFLLFAGGGSALAAGVNVSLCGQAHSGSHEWTVDTVLSTTEDTHPDVSCSTALKTVAAIDGGKGQGVKHASSPGSGESELIYGKWVCTISSGDGGFMGRKVHGMQTWVTCRDGVDVAGSVDSIRYSYGVEAQL